MTLPRAVVILEGVDPAPQGSKSAFMVKDPRDKHLPKHKQRNHPWARPTMTESSGVRVKAYRKALTRAFKAHPPVEGKLVGPVETRLSFVLPRPKDHYRTGRFRAILRDDKPRWKWAWPSGRGDLDKLIRAVHDALKSGGWYGDDVQVCRIVAQVSWCPPDEPPRTLVVVSQLAPTEEVERVRPTADDVPTPAVTGGGHDASG